MNFYKWMQRRESGFYSNIGDKDGIMSRVYSSLKPYKTWDGYPESSAPGDESEFGAVFNLEFSPEGNILLAACEKKSIALFDTITTNQTAKIIKAHNDNVNCVKFLDSRMFATCSDDTTVALWDIRNLKSKMRSLQGHSNWVKNIEFSQKDSLLVTSGFDGSIYTWDINSYTEQGLIYQKVFHTSGLMRCRLSPDATKLVICTTGGYLIIIHNLDLTSLHKDLCGFRPNIYRLMQLGRQFIPQAAKFDHVFAKTQKRNRVELVSDFPTGDDAEVILALQIHPQGWCCLSRNIGYDEGSEWSCIHDIQQYDEEDDDIEEQTESVRSSKKRKHNDENETQSSARVTSNIENSTAASTSATTPRTVPTIRRAVPDSSFVPDIWAAEVTVQDRNCRALLGTRNSSNNNAYAYVYAISSGVLPTTRNNSTQSDRLTDIEYRIRTRNGELPPPSETARPTAYRSISNPGSCKESSNQKVYKNANRLMYYAQEPNTGKGFIKEPSFSGDGRIICSPYNHNIRLLAFSNDCSELPVAVRNSSSMPAQLKVIKTIKCHSDIVVSTKFSPRAPLLVTGCLEGKIMWHHPNF